MDDLPKFLRAIFLAAVWITGCLLGGCAGPSTRVLPQESKEVMVPKEELPVLEESNPFYLQEELEILAGTPRAGGSEEEREAIRYIRQLLEDYGYDTSLQQFSSPSGAPETDVSGINVVAVRETSKPEADIVIVSACHDTLPWSPGASESSSFGNGEVAFTNAYRYGTSLCQFFPLFKRADRESLLCRIFE